MAFPVYTKVLIRSPEGTYLAGGGTGWSFTEDSFQAMVFDYEGDRVAEQLDLIRLMHGITLETVPVDLRLVNEICDCCGEMLAPPVAFFNGERFLCPDCRRA